MMIMVGTMVKPTPGAGTSVIGVVCKARRFAEVSGVVVFGRSCATNERNVGVLAAPEEGPAHTVLAVCVTSERVSASVPEVVIGDPPTEALNTLPGTVRVCATEVTVPVPAGMSAATSARKAGAAGAPVVGPAHTVLAVSVALVAVSVPDPVTGDPVTVNSAGKLKPTLVTEPAPAPPGTTG